MTRRRPCSRRYGARAGAALLLRASGLALSQPRGLLLAAGVAVGVGLLVGLGSVTHDAATAFRAALEEVTGRADLRVRGGEAGLPEDLLETVRAVPEVAVATPLVRGTVFLDDDRGEALAVFGIDLVDDEAVRFYQGAAPIAPALADDPLLFVGDARSVVVGGALAARRGLARGVTLTVVGPDGARPLTVRGVLPDDRLARLHGGDVLVMDVYAAEELLGRRGRFDAIDVVLRDDARAESVARRLRRALPAGLEVARPEEGGAEVDRMLGTFRALVEASGWLALALAGFLAYGAAASATAAARRSLGVLRAVGATRGQVLLLVLGGAALLGSAGAAAGAVLGRGLARLLREPVLHAFDMQFALAVRASAAALPPGPLAARVLAGALAAVTGAAGPAWEVTRGPVLGALRADGAQRERSERGRNLGGCRSNGCQCENHQPPRAQGAEPDRVSVRYVEGAATKRFADGWRFAAGTHCSDSLLWLGAALVAGGLALITLPAPAAESGVGAGGLALLLAGAALLAGVTLRAGARVVGAALARAGGGIGVLAGAAGRDARGRLAVTATGLALSVALLVDLAAIHASVEESVEALLVRQIRGDVVISSTHMAGGWVPAPLAGTLVEDLAALPGVTRVVTMRTVEQPYGGEPIRIRAVGGALDDDALARTLVEEGDPAAAAAAVRAGSGVLISRNLARRHALRIGDAIRLDTPRGRRAFVVAAVLTDLSSERGTVTLDREIFRRWWGDELVNVVELSVAPESALEPVIDAITRRFERSHHLQVRRAAEHRHARLASVRRAFAFTRAVEALTLLVALLAFADNLLARVSERGRELAMLRALGATRRQLAVLLVGEALLLGALGGAFGLALGSVLAVTWVRLSLPALVGFAVDFHFPVGAALRALGAALVVAAAAAWLPAWRGSRVGLARELRATG